MSEFESFRNYLYTVGIFIGILAGLMAIMFLAPDTIWFLYVTLCLYACTFCVALYSRLVLFSDRYESKCNAPIPCCAVALSLPVVFAIFGDTFLTLHQLDAPFFMSVAIAIYVAGIDVRTYGIAIPKRPPNHSAVMARIDSSGSMS